MVLVSWENSYLNLIKTKNFTKFYRTKSADKINEDVDVACALYSVVADY